MRAWTIVLFILAIHACLAMINVANVTNVGLNLTINTQDKNANVQVGEGHVHNLTLPSDPTFFNPDPNATGANIKGPNASLVSRGDFVQNFIVSILDFGGVFFKFMNTFSDAIFSIHALCAPYFGDYNAWILEGIVDTVFGVSLFQMVTGRSFKTME
jgi:hypothetical protein